jgi:hypothetical protein
VAEADFLEADEVVHDSGDEALEAGDGAAVEFEQAGGSVVEGILRVVVANGGVELFVAEIVVFLLKEHFGVVGGVFQVADTHEFPAVNGEILDEVVFGLALRVPLMEVGLVEAVKGLLRFVGEDGAWRIKAMFCCVLGGTDTPFASFWPGGSVAIAAAGVFLGVGAVVGIHVKPLSGDIMKKGSRGIMGRFL